MQTSSFSLESHDIIDGFSPVNTSKNTQEPTQTDADKRNANLSLSVTSTNSNILPKVHTASLSKPHRLAAAIDTNNSSASCSTTCSISTSTALTLNSSIESHNHHNDDNKIIDRIISDLPATTTTTTTLCNDMDESILILPEHEKLEISVSGKCETIVSTNSNSSANMTVSSVLTAPTTSALSMPYVTSLVGATTAQRRRRTSSSNSKRDGIIPKHVNNSYISRFSLPGGGVRSLPMTPPGLTDRPSIAISCPDGLAHALSEENIRLQQIVHEHKLREDVLLREIHDMRMALLKKICPNCNNAAATTNVTATNDEQCSALDNVENASISSWEAVEDRSGPSSCTTSSSIQPNAVSVLWVPDHAVSRCTSCQTEFWLGRRKHHCRSCGQIFCADCSEFWAPLPGENLLSPVRLCGPCYHSVTTRMQQVSKLQNILTNLCYGRTV
ncbi:hypothetical protein GQX74_008402 [Glossina fuscipes]|nr:hypothetical protein GQX74_008402 [Glossina fuscipes]